MNVFSSSYYLVAVLCLTACSSGIRETVITTPHEAIEDSLQEAVENPIFEKAYDFPEEWWALFDDPQLAQFIQTAYAQNPTLLSAKTRIFAAAYNADNVRSVLFPNITWAADVNREKLSTTGVIPFSSGPNSPTSAAPVTPGATSGIPVYFTLYETEFNLTYHFDFWDKNRNLFRAALGQVQANIAEEAFAKLSLGIALAKVYFEMQIDYELQEIAQSLVNSRRSYFELIQRRIHANLDDNINLNLAQSNLADATRSLQQVQSDIAVREYQLKALLAGNYLEEIFDINIARHPLNKIPLPSDLPLHLISRRPDIISQLWLIESAGRQIDAAKAGFYPDFNLSAFFGFQSIHFHELFKWPSRFFNVDPAVSLPIFDGGRLVANLRESEVNYDLAILTYNEMVLNAASEVMQNLALVRDLNRQLQESREKVKAQQNMYRLVKMKVSHNLNNKLDELTSEMNVLIAANEEIENLGNMIQAILMLIKSIGGGYNVCYEE